MRVVVAIPTRNRPRQLNTCLSSVFAGSTPQDLTVLVVDNDPEMSARQVVDSFDSGQVDYAVEPRGGVAHVRNTAIAQCSSADVLIFVDDDQVVTANWLQALLDMNRDHPEDVLTGPVHYAFDERRPVPEIARLVYNRREHDDGSLLRITGTGNTLLPLRSLDRLNGRMFDATFGRTGGEDTEFFTRFVSAGGQIRWCAAAEVIESVPPERSTHHAALDRARRNGLINARVALGDNSHFIVFVGGTLRVLLGSTAIVWARITRRSPSRALLTLYAGLGMLQVGRAFDGSGYGGDDD